MNTFLKLKASLAKTKEKLLGRIAKVVMRKKIDQELLDEIEEILIEADIGVSATLNLMNRLKEKANQQKLSTGEEIIELLKIEVTSLLQPLVDGRAETGKNKLSVWIIIGVNGVGKTTTIGKLAKYFSARDMKVMIAACDTFRAAAIDQVEIWSKNSEVELIRSQPGTDPSSLAFDAAKAAVARDADLLLVDTAGRLHTKSPLMEELAKIKRVIVKAAPQADIKCKLIIDGSTGQNALSQAQVFNEVVGLDGLIITKLDGTARGGMIIAIVTELKIPVEFIGIGEKIEDLQSFDAKMFSEALFTP